MTDSDPIRRAHEMEQLRNNGLLNAVLDAVIRDQIEAWRTAPDVNGRETAFHKLQAAEAVRAEIASTIAAGQFAERRQQRRA